MVCLGAYWLQGAWRLIFTKRNVLHIMTGVVVNRSVDLHQTGHFKGNILLYVNYTLIQLIDLRQKSKWQWSQGQKMGERHGSRGDGRGVRNLKREEEGELVVDVFIGILELKRKKWGGWKWKGESEKVLREQECGNQVVFREGKSIKTWPHVLLRISGPGGWDLRNEG